MNKRMIAGFAAALATPVAIAQFSPVVDAERLGGVEGFVAHGPERSSAGRWVAPAGDVNGDGVADLAVGAFEASFIHGGVEVTGGAGFVVFGRLDGDFPEQLQGLLPAQGFTVHFTSSRRALVARSIGAAGDFNGDGIDDLIVTAGDPSREPGAQSPLVAAVVFGRADGWPPLIDLGDLRPGEGVLLEAGDNPEWSRVATAARAGDVNGDGVSDVIIGSPHAAGGVGRVSVVFGSDAGLPFRIELAALDGVNGFAVLGDATVLPGAGQHVGTSIAAAGDVNGDGVDDVIMGAPGPWSGTTSYGGTGHAYLVYGGRDRGAVVELEHLDAAEGFTFRNLEPFEAAFYLGASVAGVGDVNQDGIADVAVSAPAGITGHDASVYILYGRDDFPGVFDPSDLDGSNATIVTEPFDRTKQRSFGYSIAGAGDPNADGVPDIVIGMPTDISGLARSYVVFGGDLPGRLSTESLDGDRGFTIFAHCMGDLGGYSVAGVGDLNGDGVDDVCVGARSHCDTFRHPGAVYVLFGGGYCRADIDANGVLDFFDVLAFQNAFARLVYNYTDWNRDGRKDATDFQALLTDFAAGCP